MPQRKGLGIETSCDETSLSLIAIDEGTYCFEEIKTLTFSQTDLFSRFGGVVPELASREHATRLPLLFDELTTFVNVKEIDYIATTVRPGLVGSLMIGSAMGAILSCYWNKPFIPIDHLEAHLTTWPFDHQREFIEPFPAIGMILSGGNSVIYDYTAVGKLKPLVQTRDDAIGEAFDKVGSLLGLPYPSGKHIERLASQYRPDPSETPPFPKLVQERHKRFFSFSGIKTSILYAIQGQPLTEQDKQRIAYYFQERVFELVERKLKEVTDDCDHPIILCGGGVFANQTLRKRLKIAIPDKTLFFPPDIRLALDNAAMVAALGYFYWKKSLLQNLSFQDKVLVSPRSRS